VLACPYFNTRHGEVFLEALVLASLSYFPPSDTALLMS
jgi:hypothetical protein